MCKCSMRKPKKVRYVYPFLKIFNQNIFIIVDIALISQLLSKVKGFVSLKFFKIFNTNNNNNNLIKKLKH